MASQINRHQSSIVPEKGLILIEISIYRSIDSFIDRSNKKQIKRKLLDRKKENMISIWQRTNSFLMSFVIHIRLKHTPSSQIE